MPDHASADVNARDENFILASLPEEEYARLRDRLEPVECEIRDMINRAGEPIRDVYFPMTAVLSMVSEVNGEPAMEVATTGREGMSGLAVFLGVTTSPHTEFAQIAGTALRMRADQLREFLATDGALHRQLHRYTQTMMVQLAQNVACNRLHSTEERAARWLLMTADRVGSERFELTQEFLAQMLGVRRATVSLTAGLLQNVGLISYRRGIITINDREGLQEAACDCYAIVRDAFNLLRKPD
jgi:CRP-like cAMP-binding protein